MYDAGEVKVVSTRETRNTDFAKYDKRESFSGDSLFFAFGTGKTIYDIMKNTVKYFLNIVRS